MHVEPSPPPPSLSFPLSLTHPLPPSLPTPFSFRYNNKTYRIDDIDFEKNPMTKFKTRSGTEMTFVDYYKNVSVWTAST